jgi:CHASE2 domain-containing sensor protein/serine phosphatase RsbU (regulator of sigma subunit)
MSNSQVGCIQVKINHLVMKNLPKLQHFINSWNTVLFAAPSVAILIIILRFMGGFQLLEWAAFDQWFRLRPSAPPDARIVIVTIDETSIRSTGQWPITDANLAKAIEQIRQQQPIAIGLDLYRDLPVEPGHQTLVEVMKSTPNLIGIKKVVGDEYSPEVNPPPVLIQGDRIAASDLTLDGDGKVRRGLISLESKTGEYVLSLGVKLSLIYLEKLGIQLEELDAKQRYYQLGKARFFPFQSNDGGYIRADDRGYQILLNYRGKQDSFQKFSLLQVIKGKMPANWGRDRIVLIGVTAASIHDDFFTPYSSSLSAFPHRMPGVLIHANIVSQILSASLDGRPQMRVWSEPMQSVWIINWSFVGAILSWAGYSKKILKQRIDRTKNVLIIGTSTIILLGSSYVFFLLGWWIPVVAPLFSLGGSVTVIAIYINYLIRQANIELATHSQEINLLNDQLQSENLRMAAELKVTHRIQEMMLPKESELTEIEGLEIAAFMEPTSEVGGDYYDFLKSDGRVKIGIGDVTGHGLESGVLMIMIQTAVRTLLEAKFHNPKEVFDVLNRTIYHNIHRMNCDKSMTLALLEYQDHVLKLSGQHEYLIIVRSSGEIEKIDTLDLGFPLGLVEDITDFIATTEVYLNAGDVVILYTDGITEAIDENKVQYGLARIIKIVKQNLKNSSAEIKNAVIKDVRQHIGTQEVYDDITLLVLKQK